MMYYFYDFYLLHGKVQILGNLTLSKRVLIIYFINLEFRIYIINH